MAGLNAHEPRESEKEKDLLQMRKGGNEISGGCVDEETFVTLVLHDTDEEQD